MSSCWSFSREGLCDRPTGPTFVCETSYDGLMVGGLAVGGDVERALGSVSVPSYVLDTTGVIRWINPAAERLVGDVRGRHFTSVVAPEDRPRSVELFTRKVLGTTAATDTTGVLVSTGGDRLALEISAVPLMNGERVVGVFGLLSGPLDDEPAEPHPHLTPRQAEVLRLLEHGRSTKQIAAELHLSTETVRNHVRHVFRALGVHSRLEAVAAARHGWSAQP
jgi:PAS domain S-box-containing protein